MREDYDELAGEIYSIFHPEPVVGSEGEEWYETPPPQRLKDKYSLDTSYWRPFEFGSSSSLVRRAMSDDDALAEVIKAQQVPRELFYGTLRLFGDAILAYNGDGERSGPYRFYPAILVSAWASFEAYVRVYSELFVRTSEGLPETVRSALLENEEYLDDRGRLQNRERYRSLLDRYWWLLKFGYGCSFDRGGEIWRRGKDALSARNELVHYEIQKMPSLKTGDVWSYLEAILLLFIGPSTQIGRSVVPDIYELYGVLMDLEPLAEEFEEAPLMKDFQIDLSSLIFPCPFDGVDEAAFPNFGPRPPLGKSG